MLCIYGTMRPGLGHRLLCGGNSQRGRRRADWAGRLEQRDWWAGWHRSHEQEAPLGAVPDGQGHAVSWRWGTRWGSFSLTYSLSLSLPTASCHLQHMAVITTLHYSTTTLPSSFLLHPFLFPLDVFSNRRLSKEEAFPLLVNLVRCVALQHDIKPDKVT